jgi:hypothetical protein
VQVIPCFGITAIVERTVAVDGSSSTTYDDFPIVAWGVTKRGDLEPIALGDTGPGALPSDRVRYRYARLP